MDLLVPTPNLFVSKSTTACRELSSQQGAQVSTEAIMDKPRKEEKIGQGIWHVQDTAGVFTSDTSRTLPTEMPEGQRTLTTNVYWDLPI